MAQPTFFLRHITRNPPWLFRALSGRHLSWLLSTAFCFVLDFGLAKLVRGATETTVTFATPSPVTPQDSVSSPGALMGTLMYMSPEQLRGEELDPRTDLFSFSALLYEMATAVPPFSGPTANEIKNAILHQMPAEPQQLNPYLPSKLGRIIRKGLEKAREQRYQNASELRTDLQRLKREAESGQMGVGASPSRLLSAFTKTGRKWMLLSAAVLALVILGAPVRAVELLQSAAQYEFGNPPPQFEVGGSLYPPYVRGQANLLLHQGAQAIAEFHKFIDRRGVAVNCPLGALARLGLARAYAVTGDKDKSLPVPGVFDTSEKCRP